ncbi:hypothetical protein L1987_48248 [Smallanthus sonchifolius]|uniref:Uncharacterized protein n=1 Tax=Smallanthus sonchifolius TaxID=185202 RepID=A0ACB9FSE8_9ASTR|nr:hypothetical protein L1987_48248 [Smallanthus sonchifolius]
MENTHPWEQQEDADADELEEGLVATRKNLHQAPPSTTINGSNNVDEEEEEEEVNDKKVDEDEKETQISEYCVSLLLVQGVWKCRICSWDDHGRTCLTHHNQHSHMLLANVKTIYETKDIAKSHVPENNDITINNRENGNGMHSVISKQNGEDEISFEADKSAPSDINNKTEITDVDEITEYDVETVLKKQDTHDLFCPNCNSCITKRVILHKRKRRIPAPGEDAKRTKPVSSPILDDSSDNQALNGVDYRLDDVQQPTSDEQDHQREPDVFRCLSCFSIFMPSGNGFKLFRVFENEENNELSHQKEVPVKKSWFSNFWGSEKVEHNVTDLNDSGTVQSLDAENNIVGVSSVFSNLNSSMQEANSHTSYGTTDLAKNQLQSDSIIRESNGKMATDSTLADIQEQLLTSYDTEKESSSKREYPGMFVVKPPLINVESTENSVSPLEHDGLKLLVPPNVGSLIIDTSQMNQELDVTVETNNPDEKGRTNLSFSPPASKLGQLGQVPINLAINGTEQKMDKYSVQSTDVMPQVSHNNVGIHLEEPHKDVLTDKQINLLDIERIKGKETIITIESKQLNASVIQRPVDTLGATALQQAVVQGGGGRSLDIIKSMVYGGLIELITSLSVVSSAAGGDATTLNVLALGSANIFGGLFVISHDLWDLKNERTRKTEDRYQQLLGQRADFPLHMAVSLISYLVFGFLPPIVYGFSFHESNGKDLKLLTVAAASIVCIMILAAGKAYVQSPQKSYFKTIGYYVMFGFMVSGVSYLFGGLIIKLLENMDIFHEGSVENLSLKPALATV